eukprot:scaffold609240_cov43-Prasinocladus_malaysianus.AAC.1
MLATIADLKILHQAYQHTHVDCYLCHRPPKSFAQEPVWLAINNLVVDPAFREKYDFNEFRKDALQSLRRYMNELLFDQLPVLKDLQRA